MKLDFILVWAGVFLFCGLVWYAAIAKVSSYSDRPSAANVGWDRPLILEKGR